MLYVSISNPEVVFQCNSPFSNLVSRWIPTFDAVPVHSNLFHHGDSKPEVTFQSGSRCFQTWFHGGFRLSHVPSSFQYTVAAAQQK